MNLIFHVSCFAEVQGSYTCCFKKWGLLAEKDNGVVGCDLSRCFFSHHRLLLEPFPSRCIKKPRMLVKSDWRAHSCPDCLSTLLKKIGISYFLILSDCTDLLNKSLPCSYLTSRFPKRVQGGRWFFDEICWKKSNKWIPVTMPFIMNAVK